jgi:hypothetical protein
VTDDYPQDTGVVTTWNREEGRGAVALGHVDLTVRVRHRHTRTPGNGRQ